MTETVVDRTVPTMVMNVLTRAARVTMPPLRICV